VIGVVVLIVVVVAVVLATALGAARRAATAGALRRAQERLRAALREAGPAGSAGAAEATQLRIREIARSMPGLGAGAAGALVLATRHTTSREVIPILAAALAHPAPRVAADAAQALSDMGSPGVRAVWRAVDAGGAPAAYAPFLLRHPDWLFERLIDAYAAGGEQSVRRHEALWRDPGMLTRLELLRRADAINRRRADLIAGVLGPAA